MLFSESFIVVALTHVTITAAQGFYFDEDGSLKVRDFANDFHSGLDARSFHNNLELDPRGINQDLDNQFDLSVRDSEDISLLPRSIQEDTHQLNSRAIFFMQAHSDPFQDLIHSMFRPPPPPPSPLADILSNIFTTASHHGHTFSQTLFPPIHHLNENENHISTSLSTIHPSHQANQITGYITGSTVTSNNNNKIKGGTGTKTHCTSTTTISHNGIPQIRRQCTTTHSNTLPHSNNPISQFQIQQHGSKPPIKALRNKRILELLSVPQRGRIRTIHLATTKHGDGADRHDDIDSHDEAEEADVDAGGDDDETARTQKDDENGAVVGKHDLRDEEAIES